MLIGTVDTALLIIESVIIDQITDENHPSALLQEQNEAQRAPCRRRGRLGNDECMKHNSL